MHPPLAPAMERELRSVRRHRAGTPIAIALAIVLTACAGGSEPVDPAEVESLREQMTALTERDAARSRRLEELETTTDRLTEAERELARLVDTLAAFDEDLTATAAESEQRDAAAAGTTEELVEQNAAILEANEQLQGTVGALRGQLDNAVGRIDRVSGEIEDLEIRYLTLRDRLDRVSP